MCATLREPVVAPNLLKLTKEQTNSRASAKRVDPSNPSCFQITTHILLLPVNTDQHDRKAETHASLTWLLPWMTR